MREGCDTICSEKGRVLVERDCLLSCSGKESIPEGLKARAGPLEDDQVLQQSDVDGCSVAAHHLKEVLHDGV